MLYTQNLDYSLFMVRCSREGAGSEEGEEIEYTLYVLALNIRHAIDMMYELHGDCSVEEIQQTGYPVLLGTTPTDVFERWNIQ